MLPYNVHHVAIAVHDLDSSLDTFRLLYGAIPLRREVVESQGVEEAMIAIGGSHLQLLQPLDPTSPVGRFLASHGEGLHHIALAVPDIVAAIGHLERIEAPLIDHEPRPGGDGTMIAFVHPRSFGGTLVELVEV